MNKKATAHITSGALLAAVLMTAGSAFAQSVAFSSEVGVGAQGSEVTSLQTWLNVHGYYNGPITGYYGSLTQAGVERFQSAEGISATGYVGPLTLAALNGLAASDSTTVSANTTEVAQLEIQLNALLAEIQALQPSTSITTTTGTAAPTGTMLSLNATEGMAANGTLNASGTGPFTYTLTSNPLDGTITSFNNSTGAFVYTPNANYSGNDSFSYTVGNGSATSAPVVVSVNVQPSSSTTTTSTTSTPSSQTMNEQTMEGVAFNGTLTATGTGPYTYQIVTQPSHGTITNFSASNGSFTYIPTANYTGTDSFTYEVGNSSATSSASTVTITSIQ